MLSEVLSSLNPEPGEAFADCTVGAGGHAAAILSRLGATGWVVGIDRDATALQLAEKQLRATGFAFDLVEGHYSQLRQHLQSVGRKPEGALDGILLDLGVSSMQVDTADRGFSFLRDGPLDMRMSFNGPTVADVVNETEQSELANIIFKYGEERRSRRIASAIVAARSRSPITRTMELANIVRSCHHPAKNISKAIDPATRTFQALRIFINDELGELQRGLSAAESLLAVGGRLAVVSFHSLEDRIVKAFFRERSGTASRGSRHTPHTNSGQKPATFKELTRRPIRPDEFEINANPRSRSARLRAAERTDATPWTAKQKTERAKHD